MRFVEDDVQTEVIEDDFEEIDGLGGTAVFDLGGVSKQEVASQTVSRHLWLIRERTQERYEVSPPAIVGRGPKSTVQIMGNLAISREHVRFEKRDGKLLIIDCGSTNGTRVQGRRIPQGVPIAIKGNESLKFGSEPFHLAVGVRTVRLNTR